MRLAKIAAMVLGALSFATAAQATLVEFSGQAGSATIALLPGSYKIALVGLADGAQYDGWSAWSAVSGCDAAGGDCNTGYLSSFGYDLGSANGFDRTNGAFFSLPVTPYRNIFDTAAHSFAVYSGGVYEQPLDESVPGIFRHFPASLTITQPQTVMFFLPDTQLADNLGGVSIDVSAAVPEPAGWLMMLTGFGLIGSIGRRSLRVRTA